MEVPVVYLLYRHLELQDAINPGLVLLLIWAHIFYFHKEFSKLLVWSSGLVQKKMITQVSPEVALPHFMTFS